MDPMGIGEHEIDLMYITCITHSYKPHQKPKMSKMFLENLNNYFEKGIGKRDKTNL